MPSFRSNSLANPVGGSSAFDRGTKDTTFVITFSVGTKVSDGSYITKNHKNDNVSAIVKNGIIEFSFPQTHPYVGVGDIVTVYGGSPMPYYSTLFLNKKISATKWEVLQQLDTGIIGLAKDQESVLITNIDKTFPSLADAFGPGGIYYNALYYIGTNDLYSLNASLRIACYKIEDILSSAVTISDFIIDENHYIKIFAPSDIKTECNSRQKHLGIAGDCYKLSVPDSHTGIVISNECVVIDGLHIDGNNGVFNYLVSFAHATHNCKIINNILSNANTAISNIYDGSYSNAIIGNIIYNVQNGIMLETDTSLTVTNFVVYNNTISGTLLYDITYGIKCSGSGRALIKNNLIQHCSGTCIVPISNSDVFNCTTSDNSSAGGTDCHPNITIIFKDISSGDYRLNSIAKDEAVKDGLDLSDDLDYYFNTDIVGNLIDNTWPIGAYHYTREIKIAIGNPKSTDLKDGSPNASVVEGILTFDVEQNNENLCSGCVVDINGTKVILYEKIDNLNWIVSQTGVNIGYSFFNVASDVVNSITVQYNNLYEVLYDDGSTYSGLYTLNNTNNDFTSTDLKATIYCSYGISDTGATTESDLVFDETRNLIIKTPNNENLECNSSRRHNGIYDTNKWYGTSDFIRTDAIFINVNYVTIDGLQLEALDNGINVYNGKNFVLTNNIIRNVGANGIYINSNQPSELSVIANNLIYNHVDNGIHVLEYIYDKIDSIIVIYNNTVIGGQRGIVTESSFESTFTNIFYLKNNLVQNSSIRSYNIVCFQPNKSIVESCWGDDEFIMKYVGRINIPFEKIHFSNKNIKDYRLAFCDSLIMNDCTVLSCDPTYQITTDFKNKSIINWGVGCDNFSVSEDKISNFSVGTWSQSSFVPPIGISINNSIITFTDPIDNMGIGDEIQFVGQPGGKSYHLSEKGNDLTWTVRYPDGGKVTDTITETDLLSVSRSYTSLTNALDVSTGIQTIIPSDLVSNKIKLNVWCYNDSEDITDHVIVSGWICDLIYKVRIATPYDIQTQCKVSQRHSGVWTNSAYRLIASDVGIVNDSDSLIDIIGLQISCSGTYSIRLGNHVGSSNVFNNIIKGSTIGIVDPASFTQMNYIANNIIYQINFGIKTYRGVAYNNTIINPVNIGIDGSSSIDFTSINNIVQGNPTDGCYSNVVNISFCISSDGTGTGFNNVTLKFKDVSNQDYHLSRADWYAINQGADVSNLPDYPYYDIDMDPISNEFSIGADSLYGIEIIPLYFSIGKNTDDLKRTDVSITQTITILNGVATFNVIQNNDNIGVGNAITYDSDVICYLNKKIAIDQWEVRDLFGLIPDDIIESTIVSIKHVYNDINEAVGSSGIKFLLGTSENPFVYLREAKYQINLPVYNHISDFTNYVDISGYDEDSDTYLKIYTPYDIVNECVVRQRHNGWDNAHLPASRLTVTSDPAIVISSSFTIIEGLIINAGNHYGIQILDGIYCKILSNIIKQSNRGIVNENSYPCIYANNIIYGTVNEGIKTGTYDIVYNNTVIATSSLANAINNSSTDTLVNNIVQTDLGTGYTDNTNIIYCLSSDSSAGTNIGCISNISLTFIDPFLGNYNLADNDTDIIAIGSGKQLVNNISYGFTVDSKGYAKPRQWCLGANEFEPRKVFYAISNYIYNDFSTKSLNGNLNFSILNNRITFDVDQVNPSLGIGYKIQSVTPLVNGCLLKEKINTKEWIVTDFDGGPVSDISSAQVSQISPMYYDLADAFSNITDNLIYDGIQINLACYKSTGANVFPILIDCRSNIKCYLRIFTPIDTIKETNSSQRHSGNLESGFILNTNDSTAPAIQIESTDFVEIEGLGIDSAGSGITLDSSGNYFISKNVIRANGHGIENINPAFDNSSEFIINNLIFDCKGDGIKAGSLLANPTLKVFIYNNTVINCMRGIYFSNPYDGSLIYGSCINNICQNSWFRDFSCNFPNPSSFFVTACISGDDTAPMFGGFLNYKNIKVLFEDKVNKNFYLNELDYCASETGLDLSDNDAYFFKDDIVSVERNIARWSRGAFENILTVGNGELNISPIEIFGSCFVLDTIPTLVIHIRSDYQHLLPDVFYQFYSINEVNVFLANNLQFKSYNLEINIQGNSSFTGHFVIPRSSSLKNTLVTIKTYSPELSLGVSTIIYDDYLVGDNSDDIGKLIIENLKVFSKNTNDFNPLVNNPNIPIIKFINSIIQLNGNKITDFLNESVQSINSILIYKNNNNNNILYLLSNVSNLSNKIYNSIIVTFNYGLDITFVTSNSDSIDEIHNILTYNYSQTNLLNIGNIQYFNCIQNKNPLFTTATITQQDFDSEILASEDFKPELNSPVFNAGDNSYVNGIHGDIIKTDIIGNDRIYNNQIVDIGPYELQSVNIIFESNSIQNIYQDKLKIINQMFIGTNKTFPDLYPDFYDKDSQYILDFSMESKILFILKSVKNDFVLLTDKKEFLIHTFEAYYDDTNKAIVITKEKDFYGDMFNNIFKDSRYIFQFIQKDHVLNVYLNDTFNKGASGDKNIVNNVRFGGTPVLIN